MCAVQVAGRGFRAAHCRRGPGLSEELRCRCVPCGEDVSGDEIVFVLEQIHKREAGPLQDQVRSSLDSSHFTPWMGAVAVLGGIWEIVFCRPAGLAPALSCGAMLRSPVPSGS